MLLPWWLCFKSLCSGGHILRVVSVFIQIFGEPVTLNCQGDLPVWMSMALLSGFVPRPWSSRSPGFHRDEYWIRGVLKMYGRVMDSWIISVPTEMSAAKWAAEEHSIQMRPLQTQTALNSRIHHPQFIGDPDVNVATAARFGPLSHFPRAFLAREIDSYMPHAHTPASSSSGCHQHL